MAEIEISNAVSWEELPAPSKIILKRKRKRDHQKPIDTTSSLRNMLNTLSVRNLRKIARNHSLILGVCIKKEISAKLTEYLLDKNNLEAIVMELNHHEKALLLEMLENQGISDYSEIVKKYGDEETDSPYWYIHPPNSIIGSLRSYGIIFSGEVFVDNWLKIIVIVPQDLLILMKQDIVKLKRKMPQITME